MRPTAAMINREHETSATLDTANAVKKIGFLYNHDELHQVAHTAPVIAALQKISPATVVEIWVSSAAQARAVERHLLDRHLRPAIRYMEGSHWLERLEKLTGRLAPFGRIGRLARNAAHFDQLDALVVPETTSTLLKTRFGLNHAKLVFLPHGAGDRSISVSEEIRHFDFVLLPGEKTRDRMIASKIVRPGNHALVGYPKFDSTNTALGETVFSNGRPTVLYNPHFDPVLSSWWNMGIDVLEYFAQQDRFNLIVAPHVMLFRRRIAASVEHRKLRFRRGIPSRFLNAPNIKIDTGSANCVDMTYTRQADVYLGDVSSQIYEFIEQPRPAVFLNSHAAKWQGNLDYDFWQLGPVLDNVGELGAALARTVPLVEPFASRQIEAFEKTFDIDPERTSAQRAASAILDFLGVDRPMSEP